MRPNLNLTKLKAFADNKITAAQTTSFIFDRVGNIVGKNLLSRGHLKSGLCGKELMVSAFYHTIKNFNDLL